MIHISKVLGSLNLVDNEKVLGEFKAGLSMNVNHTVITNKRVIIAEKHRVGMASQYRSIPLRSILSVDLVLNKKVMGDVYLNTLSGQVECHVYDSKTAEEVYDMIMKLLI